MTFKSIKRPKKSIKRWEKQKQSTYFDFFDHYRSLLIDFDLIAIFWTDNNQLCHNELKFGFKKVNWKSIWLWYKLKFSSRSIRSPKLRKVIFLHRCCHFLIASILLIFQKKFASKNIKISLFLQLNIAWQPACTDGRIIKDKFATFLGVP